MCVSELGWGVESSVISQRIVRDPPLRSCGEENTPTSPTWLVVLFQFTRMHANTHTHTRKHVTHAHI